MKRVHHLGVAAVAAGGEDHALGGVDLDVLAVLVLDDDAGDAAALILNELLGGVLPHNGAAFFLDDLDPLGVGELCAHLVGAELLKVFIDGMGLGLVHVAGVLHVRLKEHVDALLFHAVGEPVHGAAGVEEPEVDEALVTLIAGIAADLVGDFQQLFIGVGDAVLLVHDLGVVGAHLTGPGDPGGVLLDKDDLRAEVGRGGGSHQTAVAGADDDHVGLDGFRDVGDGIGFGEVFGVIPDVMLHGSGVFHNSTDGSAGGLGNAVFQALAGGLRGKAGAGDAVDFGSLGGEQLLNQGFCGGLADAFRLLGDIQNDVGDGVFAKGGGHGDRTHTGGRGGIGARGVGRGGLRLGDGYAGGTEKGGGHGGRGGALQKGSAAEFVGHSIPP